MNHFDTKLHSFILCLLLSFPLGSAGATVSSGLVQKYFPMHSGDVRYYQDHDSPDGFISEAFQPTFYNGNASAFALNFQDDWNITSLSQATGYFEYSGGNLVWLGIDTAWGSLPFKKGVTILSDSILSSDRTTSVSTSGTLYGVNAKVSVTITVNSLGTISVPAGTFQNCKEVVISENATVAGVGFNSYDSIAWVLAPGVGVIADDVVGWDPYSGFYDQDYFELVGDNIYVPPALTVQINGPNGCGTVSPNYDGQALQVGQAYSMAAKASKGFKFTGWTGGITSSSPKLSFVMAANLSLTANFTDIQNPVLAILSPKPKATVSAATIAASGKSSDNGTVAAVYYQFNDGPWVLAKGTTSWTTGNLSLISGNNTIRAYAIDSSGNASKTNSITFKH